MNENPNRGRSWRAPVPGTLTRSRMLILVVLVVLIAAAVWAVAASRGRDRDTATMATDGMAGMEGMNMSAEGSVRLTAAQITQFGITFGTVEMRTLEDEVRTVGIITVDETRLSQVAMRFGGFVEQLHVDFTGQAVRAGQPLLDIYSPELLAAQEELLVARRLDRTMDESAVPGVPAGSSGLLAAARRRLRLWDISDGQIDEILRSGRARRTLTIHAPASGVVIEKSVLRGQAIAAGQTLYTIANLSEVWVEAELREGDVERVREGSGADVELAAFPGRAFKGRVEYLYPTVQQQSRTLRARIAVANTDGRLKPGMYATVRITTPSRRVLAAPSSAIIRTGDRALAFVDMGSGSFMPHEVETGRVAGEYVEILDGLDAGDRVVTSAQFLLDSESNLAEVMRSMMGQSGSAGASDMPGMDMGGMESKGAEVKRPATSSPSRQRR